MTLPTEDMYQAIRHSKLGDDVFEEDPTVKELEMLGAEMLGKEAALFTPTGTMGNLIAIMMHCQDNFCEAIMGDMQHTYLYEVGNVSRIAGVSPWIIPNLPDGTLALDRIKESFRVKNVHNPTTKVVLLENTHNSCGGIPLPAEYVDSVAEFAHNNGAKVHVDGARIFNAATALGQSAATLCRSADSVSVCLSKGLGAPAGSLLVGNRDFISRAKYARKALGGGMRQAGVLAACGLISLRTMTKRLGEDHENAYRIAKGISGINELSVDLERVKTNILFFNVKDNKSEEFVETLAKDFGIKVGAYTTTRVRVVTHYGISSSNVDYIVDSFRKAAAKVFSRL
eukprot:CAMPEP_0203764280 /NCGR_PEP_ID=MMETSP0098-20131031/17577_1 /ASSEMBLY_ACC=CAM_ASM_000208 /TAXON_ID=96639 /ORGANISM=" , Strain NY0313808BC1" /LENGTH=340 /DNA_ID=CAMNT_0050660075 /DNA_START=40 /DNA_END=1062 /DNA_ORIENTATION=+